MCTASEFPEKEVPSPFSVLQHPQFFKGAGVLLCNNTYAPPPPTLQLGTFPHKVELLYFK